MGCKFEMNSESFTGSITANSAVGTTSWAEKELSVVKDLVSNDVEDLAYAARRELEWLNEHLIEIIDRQQT